MDPLRAFTARLLSRYQTLDPENPVRLSLQYADGLLLKQLARTPAGELPLQIAVIGPTQVGKSTLVNLLLGGNFAGISALAGYTRHAQGFSTHPLSPPQQQQIARLLPQLSRTEPALLSPDDLQRYCLVEAEPPPVPERPLLVWDSPDFDSVSSRSYRFTVPALCALADLILMVVSKEKYADQSVWDLLRLLAPTAPPLLVVINKIPLEASDELMDIMGRKFAQEGLPCPALATLPYLNDGSPTALANSGQGQLLTELLAQQLSAPPPPSCLPPLLRTHWEHWVAPLRQEQGARQAWLELLDREMATSAGHFERDYLANPNYRESLDQAILQLLDLLEVPGLAVPLAKARNLVTWPVRKVISLFRQQVGGEQAPTSIERGHLEEAMEQLVQRLQHQAGEQAVLQGGRPQLWWQHLWLTLQRQQATLLTEGQRLIDSHLTHFQPEIDKAARQLYQQLQAQPETLNALRAARVSADAIAVLLAFKTGGLGLHDLVLAPAMLAFTTLLTEGAVGQYMERVQEELKQAQRRSVQERVFLPLRQELARLDARLTAERLFGISAEQLQQAERLLEELPC
jgi:GTPase SAR1 family protein